MGGTLCRTLFGAGLVVLYADAVLRLINGVFGDGFGPLLSSAPPCKPSHSLLITPTRIPKPISPHQRRQPAMLEKHNDTERLMAQSSNTAIEKVEHVGAEPPHDAHLHQRDPDNDICTRHEVLLGNLYDDLVPWVDRGLRITEDVMERIINYVAEHRGKWDSWVTDTLTPVLIKNGKVYLTLGPPPKDPTNYFVSDLPVFDPSRHPSYRVGSCRSLYADERLA